MFYKYHRNKNNYKSLIYQMPQNVRKIKALLKKTIKIQQKSLLISNHNKKKKINRKLFSIQEKFVMM
jgi:hypothetical protein